MTIGAEAVAALPIAADGVTVLSVGAGELAALGGFGTQGVNQFRGARFRAYESQSRFHARESDQEMLGTFDKDPAEKVWLEVDFLDILHGASILSVAFGLTSGLTVVSHELVSNGEQVHLLRALISGGGDLTQTYNFKPYATCSDGQLRARTIRVRSIEQ